MWLRRAGAGAALMALFVVGPRLRASPLAVWEIDSHASTVRVHVGKTGAFSFAGHAHEVTAPIAGSIDADPADPASARVSLAFPASAFVVVAEHGDTDSAGKVQEVMRGPRVLDAARYTEVTFASRAVRVRSASPSALDLDVTGDLTLHGVTKPITVPVHVALGPAEAVITASATVRQTDFGITPVSAAVGAVKVKDEVAIDFRLVARPAP